MKNTGEKDLERVGVGNKKCGGHNKNMNSSKNNLKT